jgi:hypothetical protein
MEIITRAATASAATIYNISHIEYYTGANCSGTDGATNRILTLANTSITYNVLAYIDGLALHSSRVTITNNTSSSTIEFSDNVFNDQEIVITYIA